MHIGQRHLVRPGRPTIRHAQTETTPSPIRHQYCGWSRRCPGGVRFQSGLGAFEAGRSGGAHKHRVERLVARVV